MICLLIYSFFSLLPVHLFHFRLLAMYLQKKSETRIIFSTVKQDPNR